MHSRIKKTLLAAAIAAVISPAGATTYQVYTFTDEALFSGNGDELAAALLSDDSGINIVDNSEAFQGNFGFGNTGGGEEGGYGGEGPFFGNEELFGDDDFEFPSEDNGNGSAAFFTDLDFGTSGGTDFILPDGILLTSGNADISETNTNPGFTGIASGAGDQGLQDLLDTHFGGEEVSTDATVLAFDFTVDDGIGAISLDFMFGSEEFSEFVDDYPEIAGIFIDGVNYAVLPDGSPLTFTGQTVDAGNFFNNDIHDLAPVAEPLAVEYDGITRPLTLTGLLDQSLAVHSIKIAISDTRDQQFDSGLFVANLQGLPGIPGIDPTDPILPDTPEPGDDGFTFTIDVGDSGVGIDPLFPIFIDPDVAVGYIYEVVGSTFGSVTLPTLAIGDNLYDIFGWDGTDFILLATNWLAGDAFLFGGAGVSKFKIEGIEIDAGLDPNDPLAFITGVSFTSGGMLTVTQTPIVEAVNVPEPAQLALLLIGLFGIARGKISLTKNQTS
ncbi:MAG: choice-of-anchor L domain-containing protein [Pseudomonadales bacterium]|nr:choice-of-anchor L domain-containing protein [Pseudomonadales bacterium]